MKDSVNQQIDLFLNQANNLFNTQKYRKAKEIYMDLHPSVDCSDRLQQCDFHILIGEGDEYFINQQYEKSIQHYRKAMDYNIDTPLAEERIVISHFCTAYHEAHQAYDEMNERWQKENYSKSAAELSFVLQLYETARDRLEGVVIKDPDGKAFVSKRLSIMDDNCQLLRQGIDSFYQAGVRLFEEQDYFAALEHFQDIHPVVDCSDYMLQCRYFLAVSKGDQSLMHDQFEKAIEYYEMALATEQNNGRVEERLAFCDFAILENQASQQYLVLSEKWQDEKADKSVRDLAKVLQLCEKAKAQAPTLRFLNQQVKGMLSQAMRGLDEKIQFIQQGLESFRKVANTAFNAENYVGAKKGYTALSSVMDVEEKINKCNFFIAVEKGDTHLSQNEFDEAAEQYTIAANCNVDNNLIHERKLISQFYSLEGKGTKQLSTGMQKWEENQEQSIIELNAAYNALQEAKVYGADLKQGGSEFALTIEEHFEEMDSQLLQIKNKFKAYRQSTLDFFEQGKYLKAKQQFEQITDKIDCSQEIAACDFYIQLDKADQLLLNKQYDKALPLYEAALKYSLQIGLVKERISTCNYGIAQTKAATTTAEGLEKWQHNDYPAAITIFKKALVQFKDAQQEKPSIQFGDESIVALVEDMNRATENSIQDIQKRLNKQYQEADKLFADAKYLQAKKQYEALPITPHCAEKIKACNFHIQLKNGDTYLLDHAFQDAASAYQEARASRVHNELVEERQEIVRFCGSAHELTDRYVSQKLADTKPRKTDDVENSGVWKKLRGMFNNSPPPSKSPEKRKSNEEKVNELKKLLGELKEVKNIYPKIKFADEKIVKFASEKLDIVSKLLDEHSEELSNYYNGADKLFASKRYNAAKEAYEKLHPAIDCTDDIKKCNFFIDLSAADNLLLQRDYEAAIEAYEKLHSHELNQQMVADRIAVCNFCLLEKTSDQQYQLGTEDWKNEHFEKAATFLQKSLANMQEAISIVEKVELEEGPIQSLVNGKGITLNSRIESINRKLKDYEGDNHFKAANEFFDNKQYQEAKKIYEDLHPAVNCSQKIKACEFYIALQKADRYIYNSEYKEAMALYDQAQELEVNLPMVHERKLVHTFCQIQKKAYEQYELGRVKWQIKNFDDAVTHYQQAYQYFKDARQAAPEIQYKDNGMHIYIEERLNILDVKIDEVYWKLDNYKLNSYYRLANEFLKEKNYLKAREQYEQVLELRPDLDKVVDKIEQINAFLDKKAQPFIQRADELFKEGVAVRNTSRAKERFEKAKDLYLKALAVNPTDYLRRCVRQCGRAIAQEQYGKEVEKLEMNTSAFLNIKSLYIPIPDLSDKLGTTEQEIDDLLEKLRAKTQINKLDVDDILKDK